MRWVYCRESCSPALTTVILLTYIQNYEIGLASMGVGTAAFGAGLFRFQVMRYAGSTGQMLERDWKCVRGR